MMLLQIIVYRIMDESLCGTLFVTAHSRTISRAEKLSLRSSTKDFRRDLIKRISQTNALKSYCERNEQLLYL